MKYSDIPAALQGLGITFHSGLVIALINNGVEPENIMLDDFGG